MQDRICPISHQTMMKGQDPRLLLWCLVQFHGITIFLYRVIDTVAFNIGGFGLYLSVTDAGYRWRKPKRWTVEHNVCYGCSQYNDHCEGYLAVCRVIHDTHVVGGGHYWNLEGVRCFSGSPLLRIPKRRLRDFRHGGISPNGVY